MKNKTDKVLLKRLKEAEADYRHALEVHGEPCDSKVSRVYQIIYQTLWEVCIDADLIDHD